MNDLGYLVGAALVLAAGTYAFRLAGPVLGARLRLSDRTAELLDNTSVVMLAALVLTTTLTEHTGSAGFARPAGVVLAGVLHHYRLPLPLVLGTAAAANADLRFSRVP
ncbi:MAG: AzlD domain-containing protein [Nocardia sp.]|nr:AzlD domain-containing protein [Nocardia sp.]